MQDKKIENEEKTHRAHTGTDLERVGIVCQEGGMTASRVII